MTGLLDGIVTAFAGGVRVIVRAKPGLSRTRAIRIVDIGDGKRAVEVSVAAEAQEGKANHALTDRLATEWGLGKKALSIKAGASGRLKIVEIEGDPAQLCQVIAKKLQS